jgi:DNA-binding transcriptional ArsR family regulator
MVAKENAVRKSRTNTMPTTAARPEAVDTGKGSASTGSTLNLDQLIHERARLAIVSALAVNESLTFTEVKRILDTSDGNVSVHARKLEEAGYISCTKFFEGRMPRTEFRLTSKGRKALVRYLDHMERLIQAMRER